MDKFDELEDDTSVVLSVRILKQMKADLKAEAEKRRVRVSDLVKWWIAAGLYPAEADMESGS